MGMGDIYLYADETGNLDYAASRNDTESRFFGFGTALFEGQHSEALWRGQQLRVELSEQGVHLPKGFHAKNDSHATRTQVFEAIAELQVRYDATFLNKDHAYPDVRGKGQMYLYQLAWHLHIKHAARRLSTPSDRLIVIVGSFGTKQRQTQAETALKKVCSQVQREIVLCVWEASSCWGLQIADYGLWAIHRHLVGRDSRWYETAVQARVGTIFQPWK